MKLTGVGTEDVEDSSSPTISSCGDDAVGVDDGEKMSEAGKLTPALDEAKFLNMANIESALDTLGLCFRPPALPWRNEKSCSASSLLDSESLPWLDDVLWGDLISFVQGDCGTELARNCTSVGRLKALEWLLPCQDNVF